MQFILNIVMVLSLTLFFPSFDKLIKLVFSLFHCVDVDCDD